MADGFAKGISQNIADIQEAIVPPVQDEVGKLVEAGVTAVTGNTQQLDPQAEAKKKQEEEKRKLEDQQKAARIKAFFQQFQADKQHFDQVKAEEERRKREEEQKAAEEKKVKQFEIVQKQQQAQISADAKGRGEYKKGIGG